MKPAVFWKRLVAVIIDGFVLMMVLYPFNSYYSHKMNVINKVAKKSMKVDPSSSIKAIVVSLLVYFLVYTVVPGLYYGYFNSKSGQTLGKKAMGLRLIDKNGRSVSFLKGFFRDGVLKSISYILILLTLPLVLIRKDGKAPHDLVCDTQVIED